MTDRWKVDRIPIYCDALLFNEAYVESEDKCLKFDVFNNHNTKKSQISNIIIKLHDTVCL